MTTVLTAGTLTRDTRFFGNPFVPSQNCDAGFIPIMEVLALPFGCGEMKEFFDDIDCNGFPHVLYIVLSVIVSFGL